MQNRQRMAHILFFTGSSMVLVESPKWLFLGFATKLWEGRGLKNGILSFYECSLSDGDTQEVVGILKPYLL